MGAVLNFLRLAGLDLTPAPAQPDPRHELKRCREATVEARRRHAEELVVVERLSSLKAAASQAECEAKAAEVAYSESISSWARSGDGPVGDGELARRAESARLRADRAQLAAKGAESALTAEDWDDLASRTVSVRTTPAELEARRALRRAEEAERHARWPVLEAEIEPALARFELLMEEARELDASLQSFDAACGYNFEGRGSTNGFRERYVSARKLARPPHSNELAQLRWPWLRFDNRLKQDPESKFDV